MVPNSRGQLSVNDQYQTEVENIYAAGDVIGWPSLASAAYDQGRCAGANMSGEDAKPVRDILQVFIPFRKSHLLVRMNRN